MAETRRFERGAATVVRVVDDGFGYVALKDSGRALWFDAQAIGLERPSFEDSFGLGTPVEVEWATATGEIRALEVTNGDRGRSPIDEVHVRREPVPANTETAQLELCPEMPPREKVRLTRAVPPRMRAFGRTIDTAGLLPGDLLLSRETAPDAISRAIMSVQERGGYAKDQSRWTHAAMYVGDGAHVVEATFESLAAGGDVRLTSLDDYCQGDLCVRFRRPVGIDDDRARWSLCVRAMAKLRRRYDFMEAARMWFRVAVGGKGFYNDERSGAVTKAALCSTLYADAFAEATRRSLGEVGGICVPAWLSGSDAFDDVACWWLEF